MTYSTRASSRKARRAKGGTAAVVYHQEDVTGKKRGKEEHAGATQEPASKKLKEDGVDEDAGGKGQKKAETLTARLSRPMPEIVTLTNIDEAPRPDRKTCRHSEFLPVSYSVEQVKGRPDPNAKRARINSFELDPFQSKAVDALERGQSVLVSAHTSAGKTVVAEYAIAISLRDKQRNLHVTHQSVE